VSSLLLHRVPRFMLAKDRSHEAKVLKHQNYLTGKRVMVDIGRVTCSFCCGGFSYHLDMPTSLGTNCGDGPLVPREEEGR
jgi:hypothetical protein